MILKDEEKSKEYNKSWLNHIILLTLGDTKNPNSTTNNSMAFIRKNSIRFYFSAVSNKRNTSEISKIAIVF